jgi:hypothetical protein
MTRLATLALGLLALNGCIIYAGNNTDADFRPGHGDDGDGDGNGDGDTAADTGTDPADTDGTTDPDPDTDPASGIVISPDHGEAGDTVMISVTVVNDYDLSDVISVNFEGDVTVVDTIVRDGEILVVLDIDAAAEPGAIPVWVDTADGSVILDVSFTIEAAGSGSGDDSDCTP